MAAAGGPVPGHAPAAAPADTSAGAPGGAPGGAPAATPAAGDEAAARDALAIDLFEQPGHLIRRAQQIAVAMFVETLGREVTPVQYAILRMLQERPGLDQVTLAAEVALDNSTTADIAARLEAKGWIRRELLPRRQRRLLLTPEGEAQLARLVPGLRTMNAAMLGRLAPDEQATFMHLLRKFVQLNNEQSRAPQRSSRPESG